MASGLAFVLVAGMVGVAPAGAGAAPPSPGKPGKATGKSQVVTLITGDKVTLSGSGAQQSAVVSAALGRTHMSFVINKVKGRRDRPAGRRAAVVGRWQGGFAAVRREPAGSRRLRRRAPSRHPVAGDRPGRRPAGRVAGRAEQRLVRETRDHRDSGQEADRDRVLAGGPGWHGCACAGRGRTEAVAGRESARRTGPERAADRCARGVEGRFHRERRAGRHLGHRFGCRSSGFRW